MKKVGILAEYNPFHRGHQYQLQVIRQQFPEATIIVAMSGNQSQRGEFTLMDKWTRSRYAIEAGADIVVELPVIASLQSADYFADWGMRILSGMGIDTLAFGVETLDLNSLIKIVEEIETNQSIIDSTLQKEMSSGVSYPEAYSRSIEAHLGEVAAEHLNAPNHMLAVRYIQSMKRWNPDVKFMAIPRSLTTFDGKTILSGTQIRKHYLTTEELIAVPYSIQVDQGVVLEDYYPYLKYRIMSDQPSGLEQIFDVKNGLGQYIYETNQKANSYDELVELLTSRRFTRSSIQRKLLRIMLNFTDEKWQQSIDLQQEMPTVRLLGISSRGRVHLRMESLKTTIFTRLNREVSPYYQLNLTLDQIYQNNLKRLIDEQNIEKIPFLGK